MTRRKIPPVLRLIIVVALGFGVLFWFYSHSIIEISVSKTSQGDLTYSLFKQPAQKPKTVTTKNQTVKKIVAKGSYEVLVSQSNNGYFGLVQTKGFLSKTKVSAVLTPEKSRQFIGDSPDDCLFFEKVLYSYKCSDSSFVNINVHTPATSSSPTYISKLSASTIDGVIEGLVKTNSGNVVLTHQVDVEGAGGHVVYLVDTNLRPIKQRVLDGLQNNQTYSLIAYQSGFVIYSLENDFYSYYSSLDSSPQSLPIATTHDASLKPLMIGTGDNNLWVVFSSQRNVDNDRLSQNKNIKNSIVIYDGQTTKGLNFDGRQINEASICGPDKICLISDRVMSLYQISGTNTALAYSIGSVKHILAVPNGIDLIREKEIIRLNNNSREGSIEYSFGDYKYCGHQQLNQDKYILCIVNRAGKSQAILISQELDSDSIDKKIAALSALPEIATISIYDKYIYISPELGQLIYDKDTNGYIYDPATKQRVNQKINGEINKLGIDRQKYIIINTSD